MAVNAWYIMGVNPWYIITRKVTKGQAFGNRDPFEADGGRGKVSWRLWVLRGDSYGMRLWIPGGRCQSKRAAKQCHDAKQQENGSRGYSVRPLGSVMG